MRKEHNTEHGRCQTRSGPESSAQLEDVVDGTPSNSFVVVRPLPWGTLAKAYRLLRDQGLQPQTLGFGCLRVQEEGLQVLESTKVEYETIEPNELESNNAARQEYMNWLDSRLYGSSTRDKEIV